MDELKEANKDAIYEKLANLRVVEETIRCNDLIEAISTSVSRDKRLINTYKPNELCRRKVIVGNTLRNCRMFTLAGIHRYIQEGKIYSYENVCEYFGLEPADPLLDEMYACLNEQDLFITKKILKWLFGKRKQCKELGITVDHVTLLDWMANYVDEIPAEKYKLVSEIEYDD